MLSGERFLDKDEMAFFNHMAARAEAQTELPYSLGFGSGMTKPFYLATGERATLTSTMRKFVEVPPITFRSNIGLVDQDDGGVYNSTTVGSEFFGSINPATGHGIVSDGSTATPFTCCIAAEGFGIEDNETIDADTAAAINTLAGTSLAAGTTVDFIEIAGDAVTASGGRIEIGLTFVLAASAIDDTDPFNYPPRSSDVLAIIFFVAEQDNLGADLFSIGGQAIIDVAGLTSLADVNQNNDHELVTLRKRLSDLRGRAQLKELDATPVRTTRYLPGYDAKDLVRIGDINGNGNPEIAAVQSRRANGRILVEIKDSLTGLTVNNVWFSPGYKAFFAVALADINASGFDEIAVLMQSDANGRIVVQIRDASTDQLIRNVWFLQDMWPMDLAVIPDMTGDGADEIAALLLRQSDFRVIVEIRNSQTGQLLRRIVHPPGFSGFAIAAVSDTNGNGKADVATLVRRNSNGAVGVRLNDAFTGTSLRRIWYRPGASLMTPHPLAVFKDTNGNGFDEVGVVLHNNANARQVVQLRDTVTGAVTRSIWLPPGFLTERITSLPSVNGNSSDDVGIFGVSAKMASQVRVHDSATGTRLAFVAFPFP